MKLLRNKIDPLINLLDAIEEGDTEALRSNTLSLSKDFETNFNHCRKKFKLRRRKSHQ